MLRRKYIFILGLVITIGIAVLMVHVALGFVLRAWWSTPFEVLGFGGSPEQPVAFPHTVHAGTGVLVDHDGNPKLDLEGQEMHGLGLDCTYCHRAVTEGPYASVPPVEFCVYCHKTVGNDLPEVEKLLAAWNNSEPIRWERVHRLPDHVRFVHEAHIRYFSDPVNTLPSGEHAMFASAVCSTCHGDIGSMEEVKQVRSLKMGDCVDCHRANDAPTDCTTCHY